MRTKACIHTLTGHTNTVADLACQGVEPQVSCVFHFPLNHSRWCCDIRVYSPPYTNSNLFVRYYCSTGLSYVILLSRHEIPVSPLNCEKVLKMIHNTWF